MRLALALEIFRTALVLEPALRHVPAQGFESFLDGRGVPEHGPHPEFGHQHDLVASRRQFDAARPAQRRANEVESFVMADVWQQYGEYRCAGPYSQALSVGQALQPDRSLGDDLLGGPNAKDAFQLRQIAQIED